MKGRRKSQPLPSQNSCLLADFSWSGGRIEDVKLEPLDYASREPRRVPITPLIVGTLTLVANGILMAGAFFDRGWGATYIIGLIGPATNVILAIIAFYLAPNIRRMPASASTSMYLEHFSR